MEVERVGVIIIIIIKRNALGVERHENLRTSDPSTKSPESPSRK